VARERTTDLTPTLLASALTAAAVVWTLVVLATPIAATSSRAAWLAGPAYQIGARICHQRPDRSFHVAGVQMPVCARCLGLYVAGAAGLVMAWGVRRPSSARGLRLALAASAAPIAISVALEWVGAIETTNVVRLLTGLPPGFIVGWVLIGGIIPSSRR
jgi:uncharacterized membrane protein